MVDSKDVSEKEMAKGQRTSRSRPISTANKEDDEMNPARDIRRESNQKGKGEMKNQ